MIYLNPINVLMMTGEIKNGHPCHNLTQTYRERKIVCPVWIQPTDNFLTHPRTSFRINERWYNKYDTHKSKINKKKAWTNNLKDILDQGNQSIEYKKSEHPTGTIATTFHKPAGEANMYIRFWYSPHTVC